MRPVIVSGIRSSELMWRLNASTALPQRAVSGAGRRFQSQSCGTCVLRCFVVPTENQASGPVLRFSLNTFPSCIGSCRVPRRSTDTLIPLVFRLTLLGCEAVRRCDLLRNLTIYIGPDPIADEKPTRRWQSVPKQSDRSLSLHRLMEDAVNIGF